MHAKDGKVFEDEGLVKYEIFEFYMGLLGSRGDTHMGIDIPLIKRGRFVSYSIA